MGVLRAEPERWSSTRTNVPARVNLADLLRLRGRDAEGEALLTAGLARGPSAALSYARALARIRQHRLADALVDLRVAVGEDPEEPGPEPAPQTSFRLSPLLLTLSSGLPTMTDGGGLAPELGGVLRMVRVIRSLALLGLVGGFFVASFEWAGDAGVLQQREAPVQMSLGAPMSLGSGYSLARLDLLSSTLYYVEESYVEPSRIDYEAMYEAALEAVERRVPVTMFRREPGGSMLHVEVGDYRTVLEVPPIQTRKDLQGQLQRVAAILQKHLDKSDIQDVTPGGDPYAEVEYALVNGVLSTLDPHSVLLPPADSREMDVENQGVFGGLGITVVQQDGRLSVDYPYPDSPADRAGLQQGDVILRIDGETTINMTLDEAVERLRGEVGTTVALDIRRDGLSKPLKVTVTRESIKLNPVESQVLEGAIGYVSIKSFHAEVESELHDALARMNRETGGLHGVILDLRSNPGGYLTQAVAVADTFLDHGMIVAQVNGTGDRDSEENAHAAGTQPDYPMAVLLNASSASASEIVAGALRNNDRAVILGERSFGKGSVQNLHRFVDDSKLKLTISKYLSPGDQSLQGVGIPADIELDPVLAEWRDKGTPDQEPYALVYWRDRARREADLDKHLETSSQAFVEPAYVVPYHRSADVQRHSAQLDLADDYEVQFARSVLLFATSAHRGEILASVGSVVAREKAAAETDLEAAFSKLGIDWKPGPTPAKPSMKIAFDLGPDGQLIAGQEEEIGVEVTNTGTQPLHQLVAVSSSDNELLDGREFVFGEVDPGQTRRFQQRVRLVDGYPTEMTPVTFSLRDAQHEEVDKVLERVPVQGRDLPRFAWSWKVSDAAPGGNGNGIVDVGEKLDLALTVKNIGAGVTGEPIARLKNQAGAALDLDRGTLEPGTERQKDGTECEPTAVEDGQTEWPEGCRAVLRPAEQWTGHFQVTVKSQPADPPALELSIGDATAYDHATVYRNGFYNYFGNVDHVKMTVGEPVPSSGWNEPPIVQVTRKPGVLVDGDQVTVSGVVTDDVGVDYVMIFQGDQKVFYDGSGRHGDVRSVPFTATMQLQPGLNTISVLARDQGGFTATKSVVTYFVDPQQQAQLDVLEDNKPPATPAQ